MAMGEVLDEHSPDFIKLDNPDVAADAQSSDFIFDSKLPVSFTEKVRNLFRSSMPATVESVQLKRLSCG